MSCCNLPRTSTSCFPCLLYWKDLFEKLYTKTCYHLIKSVWSNRQKYWNRGLLSNDTSKDVTCSSMEHVKLHSRSKPMQFQKVCIRYVLWDSAWYFVLSLCWNSNKWYICHCSRIAAWHSNLHFTVDLIPCTTSSSYSDISRSKETTVRDLEQE